MIIEITSSGGFGGIAAAGMNKRVDVGKVAEPMKTRICDMFSKSRLEKLAAAGGSDKTADMMRYRIAVTDEDGGRTVFDVNEESLPAEMLDLMDEM